MARKFADNPGLSLERERPWRARHAAPILRKTRTGSGAEARLARGTGHRLDANG